MLNLYTRIVTALQGLRQDDEGVTAIEYGLIASLIAVAIIGALIAVGTALDVTFDDIAGRL